MSGWLGLRRLVDRGMRRDHYEVEEERYDDLRDSEGMIDLTEYADLGLRQREAVAYIGLATSQLAREVADSPIHEFTPADEWAEGAG